MNILLIIPCYNEKNSIIQVIKEIRQLRDQYDYIVIDDGSTDGTKKVLEDNEINHVSHMINCGLTTAFKTGIRYAMNSSIHYDAVCQFDADGQHVAKYLEKIKEKIEEGEDISIGSRYLQSSLSDESVIKRVSRKLISLCIKIYTGKKIFDPTSGMRMYKDSVYGKFIDDVNLTPEPDGLVYFLMHGYGIEEVGVEMNERTQGTSYLTLGNAIKYMINMIGSILMFQWWRK